MPFYPFKLVGNAALSNPVTVAQGGTGATTGAAALAALGASGLYPAAPYSLLPSSRTTYTVTGTTFAAITPAATTVAAGSNGGEISTVAAWANPAPGVLDVATVVGWPAAGTFTVATSTTTATCTYTGTATGMLTGVAYVSGSATGTVSTGGAVTLVSSAVYSGTFTAPASGIVVVTVNVVASVGTAGTMFNFALAAHGTVTPLLSNVVTFVDSASANFRMYTPVFIVTSLTGANNLDLVMCNGTAGDTTVIAAFASTSTTGAATGAAPVTLTVQAV